MELKTKNRLTFLVYALILGAFIGAVTWLFLWAMDFCLELIWTDLPERIDFIYLPVAVCTIGGVLVGLCKKYFGSVPGVLSIELEEIKRTKRADYKNLPAVAVSAFLPLVFGGSIGPEAALVSILGGLSTWIADHIKTTAKNVKAYTEIGAAATLSAMFGSPFFGFAEIFESRKNSFISFDESADKPITIGSDAFDDEIFDEFNDDAGEINKISSENTNSGKVNAEKISNEKISNEKVNTEKINSEKEEEEPDIFPKRSKNLIYFASAIVAFGVFAVLSHIFPESGIYRYEYVPFGLNEWLAILPLAVISSLFGYLYYIFGILIRKGIRPIKEKKVLLATVGGFILGLAGLLLPYTLFSGEAQIAQIAVEWTTMSAFILLLTAVVKIFVSRLCFLTGWRGGHIFPIIFSGLVLGYAFSKIVPVDPTFSALICSAAMTGMVLRKPVATVLVYLIICPIEYLIPLTVATVICCFIPFPKMFEKAEREEIEEELESKKQMHDKEKQKAGIEKSGN
ncbi:putative ion-transport protein YfeO [Methanimicrococcus sp. At1]|uniref:Ion-transport protein YfeO n=2 Tax=Methanimicrococcus hacksteinii TaxID=3028293 RepID=A0ABU3VRE4_9EURY|nr:putative ion-transport protein YfeO [Methanimicrococcus sp. At1]